MRCDEMRSEFSYVKDPFIRDCVRGRLTVEQRPAEYYLNVLYLKWFLHRLVIGSRHRSTEKNTYYLMCIERCKYILPGSLVLFWAPVWGWLALPRAADLAIKLGTTKSTMVPGSLVLAWST